MMTGFETRSLLAMSPARFGSELQKLGTRRAFLVKKGESGLLSASHDALEPLAHWVTRTSRDFDRHEAVFLQVAEGSGALMGAFLHRTVRGQGQGGLRFWPYDTLGGFLTDGLRLAQGMGRKNALAGLWWGGGKGVIARPPDAPYRDETFRKELYSEYGAFISSLDGCYVTAEDVGTRPLDMASVFSGTRFVTCVPHGVGGSGNPSQSTARGVVCAMEAALDFAGDGDLSGKTVAMQGIGNVGGFMCEELLARGVARVIASDISERNIVSARERFTGMAVELELVSKDDTSILSEPCDVLAPNALGGILDENTISTVRARIVCGAANNQLFDDTSDDRRLAERGVLFVPDFVANRMGIVNCANEQYGRLEDDPAITRHFSRDWENSVYCVTQRILRMAASEGTTPTVAANRLADELSAQPHPIWGHRAFAIVESLKARGWQNEA